jgi:hypothetical protein
MINSKSKRFIWKTIIIIFLIPITILLMTVIKFSFIGITTCGVVSSGKSCKTCRCIGFLTLKTHFPPTSKCKGIDLGCE